MPLLEETWLPLIARLMVKLAVPMMLTLVLVLLVYVPKQQVILAHLVAVLVDQVLQLPAQSHQLTVVHSRLILSVMVLMSANGTVLPALLRQLVVALTVTIQPILPHKTPSNALVEMKLPVLRTSSLITVPGTLLPIQLPASAKTELLQLLPVPRSLLPAYSPSR